MINVAIIEDEELARRQLKRLLEGTTFDFSIVFEGESVADAITFFNAQQPVDLLFLDIQLSDGLSFDIFKTVAIDTPVIFTTAFNQYTIQAFKQNSIDYLLKPIAPTDLQQALEKFDRLHGNKSVKESAAFNQEQFELLSQLLAPSSSAFKMRFLGKFGNQLHTISTQEIAYFYADDIIVFVVTEAGKRYQLDYKLDQLEQLCDPKLFYRINRKLIIKASAVKHLEKHLNGRYVVQLEPTFTEQVLVSKARVHGFLNWLQS